jgi:hypothetical protein
MWERERERLKKKQKHVFWYGFVHVITLFIFFLHGDQSSFFWGPYFQCCREVMGNEITDKGAPQKVESDGGSSQDGLYPYTSIIYISFKIHVVSSPITTNQHPQRMAIDFIFVDWRLTVDVLSSIWVYNIYFYKNIYIYIHISLSNRLMTVDSPMFWIDDDAWEKKPWPRR